MDTQTVSFGGNQVRRFAQIPFGESPLASGPYMYRLVRLAEGESWCSDGLGACTLLRKDGETAATARVEGEAIDLAAGDSVHAEGTAITIRAIGGPVSLLMAGGAGAEGAAPAVTVTRDGGHYRVLKPWGHELWLNGEHPVYCFKEVFIRAPHRTSLQFHRFKQETNLLFAGAARLVFNASGADNLAVTPGDLGDVPLTPLSAIDVEPGILHRLVATDDALLYEVSTPHLDDVVRIQDDNARGDGRIAAEHRG